MKNLIRELKYWWNCKTSGLQTLTEDLRDLHFSDLFGVKDFKSNWEWKKTAPVFQKNQRGHSDCSFQAWANAFSVYFGQDVSAHWLRLVAYWNGWCNAKGEAELRGGAKVGQKIGVLFESEFPSDETLSNDVLNKLDYHSYLKPEMKDRKIGSFYRLDNVNDVLRAIDKGYGVVIGRKWLTSMNTGGGFKAPWIIRRIGRSVGAHGLFVRGADLRKDVKGTTIELNSYGSKWGDKGYLYCPLEDLQQDIDRYGAYCITPVPYNPKDILIKEKKSLLAKLIRKMREENTLVKLAKEKLNTDFTDDRTLPDDVSCVFATSTVCHEFDGRIPIFYGTFLWDRYLVSSPLFQRVKEPVEKIKPGDIVVSPTGLGDDPKSIGHTGIYLNATQIMSNSSYSGKWLINFTRLTWRARYWKLLGMPVRIYRYIG